jgi:hypothetical protein
MDLPPARILRETHTTTSDHTRAYQVRYYQEVTKADAEKRELARERSRLWRLAKAKAEASRGSAERRRRLAAEKSAIMKQQPLPVECERPRVRSS